MKSFFTAVRFLTVLPLRGNVEPSPEELRDSMRFFPLVGALQGAILVLADLVLGKIFPAGVESALLLTILFFTNNGLHLDGFADTVDGLAGGKTKEERLRIMRDSTVGAIGVSAVIFLVLIKYSCIENLSPDIKRAALFLFPVIGRWVMVPMATWGKYAREEHGLGANFSSNTNKTFFIASLITLLPLVWFFGIKGMAVFLILLVLARVLTNFFIKKLGGVTGDVFGFQSELGEALFLLFCAAKI
ncbi:MAG: adenosylcobinamide-GDP ribazoletransferase [Thermodesulfobacteriota bacterium]